MFDGPSKGLGGFSMGLHPAVYIVRDNLFAARFKVEFEEGSLQRRIVHYLTDIILNHE
jgi:hypothetical protein